MNGLSSTTVIQTTWRSPFVVHGIKEFRIAFQSTTKAWVSFLLNTHTGIIYDIQGFDPKHQIPNWYSDTPFTDWSITIDETHSIFISR